MENSIFETKEAYLEMRNHFKTWYNTEDNRKTLQAKDFALYALLRSRDWKKCFTQNADEQQMEFIHHYLTKTKFQYLNLTPFGKITEDQINSLREREITKWGEK